MTSVPEIPMDESHIYAKVQEAYSTAVRNNSSDYGRRVATAFGYSEQELTSIPADANLGETVVDLGSGAGFDVFLAANMVGRQGKAIGVDMNKDMLERAERNKKRAKSDNVLFVESRITHVVLPDATADCVISNCVINLVPEGKKQLVFNEMFRLLKPGGRVAISDILIRKELSQELKRDMALYVGCIAGASQVKDYEEYLRAAGFAEILIVDANNDLNVYKGKGAATPSQCCGTDVENSCCNSKEGAIDGAAEANRNDFTNLDFNEWAGSFKIYAIKV